LDLEVEKGQIILSSTHNRRSSTSLNDAHIKPTEVAYGIGIKPSISYFRFGSVLLPQEKRRSFEIETGLNFFTGLSLFFRGNAFSTFLVGGRIELPLTSRPYLLTHISKEKARKKEMEEAKAEEEEKAKFTAHMDKFWALALKNGKHSVIRFSDGHGIHSFKNSVTFEMAVDMMKSDYFLKEHDAGCDFKFLSAALTIQTPSEAFPQSGGRCNNIERQRCEQCVKDYWSFVSKYPLVKPNSLLRMFDNSSSDHSHQSMVKFVILGVDPDEGNSTVQKELEYNNYLFGGFIGKEISKKIGK